MLGNGELLSISTEQRVILASTQVAQGSKGPTQPTTQLNKTQVVYQKAHLKQIPGQLGLHYPHQQVTELLIVFIAFRKYIPLQVSISSLKCPSQFQLSLSIFSFNLNFPPTFYLSFPFTSPSASGPSMKSIYLLPPGNLCATVCSEVNSSILNISEYDGSMNCQFIILALANIHT